MEEKLISIVIGTRPEAIKLSCLIKLIKNDNKFKLRIILTGQHEEMVSSVLDFFEIMPNINFFAIKKSSNLTDSLSFILKSLNDDFTKNKPDFVIVQGDTTTALAGGLASFYNKIPFGHVEAGLRTESISEPFPEECNRRLISQMASFHFAPTEKAKENLVFNNIKKNIYVTGNTVIDSLKYVINKNVELPKSKLKSHSKKFILATIHRRENWGANLNNIAYALKEVINQNKELYLLIPLHPNKIVSNPITKILGNHPRIDLVQSLSYQEFIKVLNDCYFLLTDSGGLQEESPSLDKPVLVLRNNSERLEAVESGAAKLIGNSYEKIVYETNNLINDKNLYLQMANAHNPFGDGHASKRIRDIIYDFFN